MQSPSTSRPSWIGRGTPSVSRSPTPRRCSAHLCKSDSHICYSPSVRALLIIRSDSEPLHNNKHTTMTRVPRAIRSPHGGALSHPSGTALLLPRSLPTDPPSPKGLLVLSASCDTRSTEAKSYFLIRSTRWREAEALLLSLCAVDRLSVTISTITMPRANHSPQRCSASLSLILTAVSDPQQHSLRPNRSRTCTPQCR